MGDRFLASSGVLAILIAIMPPATVPVAAQTPVAAPQTNKTAATKAWIPARTADGQPEVQGFWAMPAAPPFFQNIEEGSEAKHTSMVSTVFRSGSAIVDPPDGKVPYQPWAAAIKQERLKNIYNPNPKFRDPVVTRCVLAGVPRIQYEGVPPAFQILQAPGSVVLLFERLHAYRIIPLDGRPHAADNIKLWMGDSRGRWEGNTLIVDVTNHNDKPWLDWAGTFHSDAFHVVERWTFVDTDRLNYEATIEDPKVYTKPWKLALTYSRNRQEGYEPLEDSCYEGEQLDADKYVSAQQSTQKTRTDPR